MSVSTATSNIGGGVSNRKGGPMGRRKTLPQIEAKEVEKHYFESLVDEQVAKQQQLTIANERLKNDISKLEKKKLLQVSGNKNEKGSKIVSIKSIL